MKHQRNIFAVILFCFAGVGIGYSQTNSAFYHQVSFGVNALPGVSGFDRHMSENTVHYPDSYVPTFQVGYTFGVAFNKTLFLGVNAGMNYGIHNFKASQYKKKDDILTYLDFNYKFLRKNMISCDAGIGFGTSVSNIFASYVDNGKDVLLSFQSIHCIMPLSFTMWVGDNDATERVGNKLGVFLQYMISMAQIGETKVTGLSSKLNNVSIVPATLTLGLKYQF